MNTEIAIREPQRVQMSPDQLRYIANTEFVPQGLRGNLPAIMACVATGRALGIDDMSALRLIHVVNGKPTFSAELMVQIVRKHGHSITGEVGDGAAVVTGTRVDNGDTMTVKWTLAMAERAGLAGKATWKAYPESLLWARAASQLCRQLFADCFAGGTYTPDELDQGTPAEFEEIEGSELDHAGSGSEAVGEPQASGDDGTRTLAPTDATGVEPSPTAPQLKKLNVLVGTLREAGHITTPMVWQAVGRDPVVSEDGELHWSPLRDSLTKDEASALIERLERFAETKREAA